MVWSGNCLWWKINLLMGENLDLSELLEFVGKFNNDDYLKYEVF